MALVEEHINALDDMKKYPKELFYAGNLELLKKKSVAIVGSRKPSKYSRVQIEQLSSKLSRAGICVVSGGAMGIDAMAHKGAGGSNTVAVLPCGIDLRYPAVNKSLLDDIEANGLLLSQFKEGEKARPYSFVLRNEIVVALGDILIVGEADEGSGTMRSIEFALKMNKEIYVLSHRIGESVATNKLLQEGKAKAITDIDAFMATLYPDLQSANKEIGDDFSEFCKSNPSYEEALGKFPSRVFEAELAGEIIVKDGKLYLN